MRIIICSNIQNGIGLQREYELLRGFLEAEGHEVAGQQFDQPAAVSGDLCIWIEVFSEHLVSISPRHWWIANPEWTKPEFIRPVQRYCEKIFAKTHDAVEALREKFPNVEYVGFLTEDKRDLSVPREARFLHLGGNSGFRNTAEVISAWREYRWWGGSETPNAELTVVSNSKTVDFTPTPGITFIKRATDKEVKRLQNSHLFHLLPSAYEGFGHALHEAQSVGAIVLTTDAPPMNELKAPRMVPAVSERRNNLGTLYQVSPADIRESVPWMLSLPNYQIAQLQIEARVKFERGNEEFRRLFSPHLERPVVAPGAKISPSEPSGRGQEAKKKLALFGNFDPPHSTENDLLWTLQDMGYEVQEYQENRARTEAIAETDAELLIWVHTHGWETPGDISLDLMLAKLRARGVKTASFHLDRYWGLNRLDQREDRIGIHPFWRTQRVFTADGGNDERFRAKGVNHYWLPPGVIKRDCYVGGEPDPDLAIDVGFVGAEGYHPEYPFRGQLIEFLRSVYGDRFKVFTGFRGVRLNNLYASIRVVVGDSCFGGADRYWSDRIPESLGRGAFLIHPGCRGLDIPGLVTFRAGELEELQDRIDYYLVHRANRMDLQNSAQQWVKDNETYHNRMAKLLRICGVA